MPKIVTLDVRTPAEFANGHVPGAISFPLFTNEERHEVGLCYKQQGKDMAVKLGLKRVGPKLSEFVNHAEKITPNKHVNMYCWRGGMRSASMAWLLRMAGFEVNVLKGGYKHWRNDKLSTLQGPLPLINIGGMTGVGKTPLIEALASAGEQVLNLESMANHRGSAFGQLGEQPTTEQFENMLGLHLQQLDHQRWIWTEDESRSIGRVYLNTQFFQSLRGATFVFIEKSVEKRLDYLCALYGQTEATELIAAFERLRKRMGGQFVNEAIAHLNQGDLRTASALALKYYDNAYQHSLKLRKPKIDFRLDLSEMDYSQAAQKLIEWKNQNLPNTATARAAAAK